MDILKGLNNKQLEAVQNTEEICSVREKIQLRPPVSRLGYPVISGKKCDLGGKSP